MKDQASKLRTMVSETKKEKKIKIISVISGSGSIGKTNLIMNLAIELKNRGKNVLILDLTEDSCNFSNYIDLSKIGVIDDNPDSLINIQDYIIMGPEGIDILLGAENISKIKELDKSKKLEALYKINFLSKYDFILIDNKPGLSENMLTFINFTNDIILLTQPDLDNVVSAYKLIKIFAANNIKDKMYLVINNIKSEQEAVEAYEKLKNTSEKFLGFSLKKLGNIYNDKNIEKSNEKKVLISTYNEKSKYSEDILEITDKILTNKNLMSNTYTMEDIKKRVKVYFK